MRPLFLHINITQFYGIYSSMEPVEPSDVAARASLLLGIKVLF